MSVIDALEGGYRASSSQDHSPSLFDCKNELRPLPRSPELGDNQEDTWTDNRTLEESTAAILQGMTTRGRKVWSLARASPGKQEEQNKTGRSGSMGEWQTDCGHSKECFNVTEELETAALVKPMSNTSG